jgi:hypothetical protein
MNRESEKPDMLKNNKVSVDLRIVVVVLVVLLGVCIGLWKPWVAEATRTIEVTGESSIESEPDEYQFMPMYQKKGADRAAIQQELIATVNSVVARLKELGVAESDISLASSTYDNYWNDGSNEITSNSLTITVDSKELSQKVQDYLITTSPEGQITPYATFSIDRRKAVQEEARSEAIADARAKAERTASELGMKLGKVVTIEDYSGDIVLPYAGRSELAVSSDATSSSLPILPGTQDISTTVTVTYEIK